MTQYAVFNPAVSDPKPVTGWIDTGWAFYASVPPGDHLLALTPSQWTAHLANPGGWAISGGALVAAIAPSPTPQGLAAAQLAAGLGITSTGTSGISATYPADAATLAMMGQIQTVIAATTLFPGSLIFWNLKTSAGTFKSVNAAQFTAIYGALCVFAATCGAIVGGSSVTAPSSSATIA